MKFTIETPNEKVMKDVVKLSDGTKDGLRTMIAPLLKGVDKKGLNGNSAKYDINIHNDKHMRVTVKLSK